LKNSCANALSDIVTEIESKIGKIGQIGINENCNIDDRKYSFAKKYIRII